MQNAEGYDILLDITYLDIIYLDIKIIFSRKEVVKILDVKI